MKQLTSWAMLAFVLTGLLAWLCANGHRGWIQRDVAARTRAELTESSLEGIEVTAHSGRDLVLSGSVRSEELKRRAASLASGVYGVRKVDNELTLREPASLSQSLRLVRRGNATRLGGVVPDESVKERALRSARELFGADAVTDELLVSETTSAPWIESFESVAQTFLTDVEDGTLDVSADRIVLEGMVDSERRKTSLGSQIQEALPERTLDNRLRIRPRSAAETQIREMLELRNIEFETNSDRLTLNGRRTMDQVLEVLRDLPDAEIEISGHTDSTGEPSYNLVLSQRRADAVRRYLGRELDVDSFSTVGYGAERPIADNGTPRGRQRNRRIEFRVLREN